MALRDGAKLRNGWYNKGVKQLENYKRQRMEIDLSQPIRRKEVGLVMGSGDDKANTFYVIVKDDGSPVTLSGCTVIGYLIMPNDETLRITGRVEDNMACVTVPKSGYVYDGAFTLTIKTAVSKQENTLAIFDGTIGRTTTENITDGQRIIYGVNEILALIGSMEQAETDTRNATTAANNAAASANSAASKANTATTAANNAADYIKDATVSAEKLPPGSTPTAAKSEVDGHLHLTFGLVTGDKGDKGDQGRPYTIIGNAYATPEQLAAAITSPAVGDQYNVGTEAPYNVYRWTGTRWEDQGVISSAGVSTITETEIDTIMGE